jgi:hypothetical protein
MAKVGLAMPVHTSTKSGPCISFGPPASGELDYFQAIWQLPKDKTRIFSPCFRLLLICNIFLNNGRADPPSMPAIIIREVKENVVITPDGTDAILFSTVPVGTHHLVDPSKCCISPSLQ